MRAFFRGIWHRHAVIVGYKRGDLAGALETDATALLPESGRDGPCLLDVAARKGDIDLVTKNLAQADDTTVVRLAKIRLAAGDRTGTQQILERGIKAAQQAPPNRQRSPWAMIQLLADTGATDAALQAGSNPEPHSAPFYRTREEYDTNVRLPQMALLQARTGHVREALGTLAKIKLPQSRERAVYQLITEIAAVPAPRILIRPAP